MFGKKVLINRYNTCGCTIKGSTLTVPNLAPSLLTYLEMASRGEKIPIVGSQFYDESLHAGQVRTSVSSLADSYINVDRSAFMALDDDKAVSMPVSEESAPKSDAVTD